MRVVLIDNEDGRLVADVFGKNLALHVKNINFSPEAFAGYRENFEKFVGNLAGLGYERLFATPKVGDSWAISMCRYFGFNEQRRHRGFVVMQREMDHG